MATIEPYATKGGRRYRVNYRTPDRRQTTKRGFRTKREAEAFAATVEVQKMRGEYIAPSAGRVTVRDYAEQWMNGKVNLSASTSSRYRSALDVHILPTLGGYMLCDVTRERVRQWITTMSATSSAATVHKNVGVLRQVFGQAVRDSRLAVNPVTDVDLPRIEHAERRFLTVDQVRSLADTAGTRSVIVYTLAYCGLRFGEAAALAVGDVDLEARRIRVHRSVTEVDSQMVWSPPKSNTARTIAVPAFLASLLGEHLAGRPVDALVFPDSRGGPLRVRNVRRGWWDRAVRESSAPSGLTPHELRHTAASLAIQAGASIKVLQRMLGHSSASLTLDRYGHLYPDDLGMVADRLDALAGGRRSLSLVAECGQNVVTNSSEAPPENSDSASELR